MTFTQVSVLGTIALQKPGCCFNHRLVTLQTNWRDSGYERFTLVLETKCTRQPKRQLPSSSYNHNTLKTVITSVFPSPGYKFLTATLKCICNDSFTDVLSVLCQLVCNHSNYSVVRTTNSFLQCTLSSSQDCVM